MDPLTRSLMMGAAGAGEKLYVEDVFSTWLYTGNGSTQTITNGIDLSGKGGLVWLKRRNDISEHGLYDTARGAAKLLQSQSTAAQISSYSGVSAFGATGFDLGTELNANGGTYASWTFRKAAKFFDVVTYVGDGNTTKTVSHNLGSVPGSIIAKGTSAATDWPVYHRGLNAGVTPEQWYLRLNATAAQTNAVANWGNTAPTSTTFTVGANNNVNGISYVAYLFAHDAGTDGLIQCGYSTNGTFNNLGWEPQWVLAKPTSNDNWYTYDNMRGLPVSGTTPYLSPNLSGAEANGTNNVTVTATGFTQNLGDCVWIAIRRGPMKTPTVGTEVFSANTTSASVGTKITTDFTVDLQIYTGTADAADRRVADRLRGVSTNSTTSGAALFTDLTDAESTGAAVTRFFDNTGFTVPNNVFGTNNLNTIYWNFRRAPGFFDVVAYTGTGANRTVSHNLGVAPELMIVKARSAVESWAVYSGALPATSFLQLNDNGAERVNQPGWWNSTAPTSSVFTVGNDGAVNGSGGTYIAYLFATCPGVSKVGNYTGTGTTLSVDCGFTNGARFVLIKRTDSTGDWYVWDTARGIIAANDPYLLLNSTAAEVTNTDYIDPLSSGFQISSTAPAAINANGGSFIFLAIA